MKMLFCGFVMMGLLSCLGVFPAQGEVFHGDGVSQATEEGVCGPPLFFRETGEALLLGNGEVTFRFSRERGGALVAVEWQGEDGQAALLTPEGEALSGRWIVGDLDGVTFRYAGAACRYEGEEAELTLRSVGPTGELTHRYRLGREGTSLRMAAAYQHTALEGGLLSVVSYRLDGVALGGSLEGNEYLYPPGWLHWMRGPLRGATHQALSERYVYGAMQPTDKSMLPYAMLHHPAAGESLALAGVNSRAKVFMSARQSEERSGSGLLEAGFALYRTLQKGETGEVGVVYLSAWRGDWRQAMAAERELLVREAGFRAPESARTAADLVIVWHGAPGVEIDSFQTLGERFRTLSGLGVNAVILGGKLWNCPASSKGEGTIFDYIPLPENGWVVPAADLGGLEGFRQLISTTHDLGMKLFTWGPASMAGIARQSAEAATEPEWWIRDAEGGFHDWYSFMAPANPHAAGWRSFFTANVRKIVRDYGVDGFWLDSTWQDHQLHLLAPDGWQGGPNGDKMSLLDQIVQTAREENPKVVIMAEGGGAEVASRVDVAYLQVHGIWPAVPPAAMQEMIEAQELSRLPGARPFGQIELGLGFYGELADPEARSLAGEHRESWQAKSFLVGTLDRIPVYFGFSSWIDMLAMPERHATYSQKTRDELALFAEWQERFRTLNRVRREHRELIEGETLFDALESSSPSVVRYLRCSGSAVSVVALNAERFPLEARLTFLRPERLRIVPGKHYHVTNLMNGQRLPAPSGGTLWRGADLMENGLPLHLKGYEGAIFKIAVDQTE